MKKKNRPGDKAIGIDLGATRIKGVLIDTESGEIIKSETKETKDGQPQSWKRNISEVVEELGNSSSVNTVGLAAPGLAASDYRSIAKMPGRMAGLEGLDWSGFLGRPVSVINDAHAAITAEVKYGVARGFENIVMLTLGTGVGGGLWLNGRLYQGYLNRAGHLGHISLDADSLNLDITQIPGSLENAIGNISVASRTFNQFDDTRALVEAYRQGHVLATWAWLNSVRYLATGIASLINSFSPEVVVLGGGITGAGDALFGPLQKFMDIFEWRPGNDGVPIMKAHFDEWSGAVGAAARGAGQF